MTLCASAMAVMLKNTQTNDYGSVSYNDLGGFMYLVYANEICDGYSFLSSFHTARTHTFNVSTMPMAWTYFFFDQCWQLGQCRQKSCIWLIKDTQPSHRVKAVVNMEDFFAHIITAVIGSGPLSLAWSTAQLGWIVALISMFCFSIVAYVSASFLSDCYRSPHPMSGTTSSSYIDAVRVNLGSKQTWVCKLLQYITMYEIGVAYVITTAAFFFISEVQYYILDACNTFKKLREGKAYHHLEACEKPLKIQYAVDTSQSGITDLTSNSHKEQLEILQQVFSKAAEDDTPTEVPDYLCCKLTLDIFRDPVITPSGVTYKREVLLDHLKKGTQSLYMS
ncbi:Amino acid permease [Thalictrum thalictroides]|uniref:CASP-like protein n=1 Tax=Thalictrum thalictroides TaxID=46969 RepID=A0A7J6VU69_THATH|nr:Amino acid permease [Thalictrum thalictroides]